MRPPLEGGPLPLLPKDRGGEVKGLTRSDGSEEINALRRLERSQPGPDDPPKPLLFFIFSFYVIFYINVWWGGEGRIIRRGL